MDNGAYEDEMLEFRDLFNIAVEVQPKVLVCPDFIARPKETRYVTQEFAHYIRMRNDERHQLFCTLMAVPQPRFDNFEDFLPEFLWAQDLNGWVGIPKWIENRTRYVNVMRKAGLLREPIHMLGVNRHELMGNPSKVDFHKIPQIVSYDSKKDLNESRDRNAVQVGE